MANGTGATEAGSALKGAGTGAAMGAEIGSFVGPEGTAIGAAAGGLIGGVAGFFSGKKQADIQSKKQGLVSQRELANQNYYNTEYNKDILDTAQGKALQTGLENSVKEANLQSAGTGAITGASDESKIAQKTGMEGQIANAYGSLAASGQSYKQGIRNQYLNQQMPLDQQQQNLWTQQQQSINNAMANFSGAGKDVSSAFSGSGGTKPGSIFQNDSSLSNKGNSDNGGGFNIMADMGEKVIG
jgi:hypothetical protein